MGSSRTAARVGPGNRRRWRATIGVLALVTLVAATVAMPVASAAGKPRRGGEITFGIEAETTGGWCLPQAQLAAGGIQVATAVYDTLTVVDAKGDYVPYLAKTITPNATNEEWTITLRDGVTFHDGTPLDAAAVKLNMDSWRGVNPRLPARLLPFVFTNIADVRVVDPLTLVVTTKTPWPAFPATLAGGGRYGIAAPAQLNAPETCASNLIGTGPFTFQEWRVGEQLVVVRNPNYWQKGYPLLDQITFRPVGDASARLNQFEGGSLDVMQTTSIDNIVALRDLAKDGKATVVESDKGAGVSYLLLNAGKAPFDDILARRAMQLSRNTKEINQIRNRGIPTLADGPFSPGVPGHLRKSGTPKRNVAEAKRLVAQYEAKHGEPPNFEYDAVNTPDNVAVAELVKEQAAKVGITVTIRTVDQASLINDAIAGNYQAMGFRNHEGFEPDTQLVWWHTGSPLNFGRIQDPELDRLLDTARSEPDPAKRTALYEDLSRRFADQAWNLWSWYTLWQVAAKPDVRGLSGPKLPDGGKPAPLIAGVVPVLGIWLAGR